jgi:hypothetical protein
MIRALYVDLVLIFSASGAIGEGTDTDRVAIQKGSFHGCLEKMPAEVRARFGHAALRGDRRGRSRARLNGLLRLLRELSQSGRDRRR